jgi:methylmalonyl-CoA mutase
VFAGANGAHGFGLDPSAEAVAQVLDGIYLDAGIGIELQIGPQSRLAAIHMAEYVKRKGIDPAACDIRFGLDPLGSCAVWGFSPYSWQEIVPAVTSAIKGLAAMGFEGPLAVADGRVIHDAGGSEVQELAFVLAAGVAYLRAIEQAGVALEDAQGMVYARPQRRRRPVPDAGEIPGAAAVVGADRTGLRADAQAAVRRGRYRVAHADAARSLREHAARDDGDLLRRLGGANSITVLPHTLALGLPDPFARRAARNTQLVLLEESNLAKVSDPAAGSGGIEALTDSFANPRGRCFRRSKRPAASSPRSNKI